MSRTYDKMMELEYLHDEYCCCECGYYRNGTVGSHPGVRCPNTGRCGICGNDWPCEEHIGLVPKRLIKKVNRSSYVKNNNE
jgi:hypothetical protein